MRRIWGFDLGTTSVGFAVVDYDERQRRGSIQRMGVRIFPEGVEPVGGGKNTAPRNQKRRSARLVRRQIRRRRWRRRELGALLHKAGLLPPFGTEEWRRVMNAKKGASDEDLNNTDPYELRVRSGLKQALEPHQIGRALYHLAKRRGFRTRRYEEQGEETEKKRNERKKDEGVVNEGIESLRNQMAGRTLGAFLAEVPEEEPKRKRHIGRDMVEAEFDDLWKSQARLHPDLLTDDLKERVRDVAFHQRPTFWRLKTLGKCHLEPASPLCLKGSWLGQRFLMLQRVNNLRLAGGNRRPLDEEERALILELLEGQASATFGSIRKTLKPLWKARGDALDAKFNFEVSQSGPKKDKTEVPGNATEGVLRSVFGERWEGLPPRDRIRREIAARFREMHYRRIGNKRIEIRPEAEVTEYRGKFISEAQADYGITEEEAEKLSKIRLPAGWLRLSEAAIEKLLPHMEGGRMYGDLINDEKFLDKAFPNRLAAEGERQDRLPSRTSEMPDLRNPTVARSLTELRKVTNNLLAVYGKPDLVRIELARDLKLSKKQKEALDKRQRAQDSKRKEAKKDLQEKGFVEPSDDDIEKWLLWKECKETCPYTGKKKIGFDALFRRGEFTVEHIWPRSRSLDNSFANKTLCETDFNIHVKKNRTPFEVFRHDTEKWEEVKTRLASLGLPEAKVRRFVKESFDEAGTDEFSERQLVETGYTAREARKFLARLYGTDGLYRVQPTSGRVTAQLRHYWGLDTILNPEGGKKVREDHRHHAVDALAVTLTTRAFVKRLSDYYAREKTGRRPDLRKPWPTLRDDAEKAVRSIIVSHRARRKISGPLHAETALGDTGEDVIEDGITYRLFVKRKALAELSGSEFDDIRDKKIRCLVKERLGIHDDAVGKAKKCDKDAIKKALTEELRLPSRNGEPGRLVRKVRINVKRQKKVMLPLRPERKTYAELGKDTNHHIAIYDLGNGKADHDPVTRIEAAQRLARGEPVVKRISDNGGRLILSLCPGDILEMVGPDGEVTYVVVRKFNEKGRVFYKPTESATEPKPEVSFGPKSFVEPAIRKVVVDPIGRVREAND